MKPTIGIIGGCGPLATLDIEFKILKAIKQLLPPLIDQNYFNMLVFNYTQFSDRNDAISVNDNSLFEQFLKCARALELIGADFLLVACQTAHVYAPQLKSAVNLPIIDIIEETTNAIIKSPSPITKVGLLSTEATQKKQLYQNALATHNIEVVSISTQLQAKIMEAIYIIKTGADIIKENEFLNNMRYCNNSKIKYPDIKEHPYKRILLEKYFPNPLITIQKAIQYLANHNCQHIILGCTELPLMLPYLNLENIGVNLIDPNTIIAESAVIFENQLEQEKTHNIMYSVNSSNQINSSEGSKLCVG